MMIVDNPIVEPKPSKDSDMWRFLSCLMFWSRFPVDSSAHLRSDSDLRSMRTKARSGMNIITPTKSLTNEKPKRIAESGSEGMRKLLKSAGMPSSMVRSTSNWRKILGFCRITDEWFSAMSTSLEIEKTVHLVLC